MLTTRTQIWIAIGALAFLGLTWAFSPRPLPVDGAIVQLGDMTVSVSDDGMTRVRDVFILSAPADGIMSRVEVEPGDTVEEGKSIITTLRSSLSPLLPSRTAAQLRTAVQSAEASLVAARADKDRLDVEHQRLKRDLERAISLRASGTVSQQAVDDAEVAERAGYLGVRSAEAMIGVRRQELAAARAALLPSTARAKGDTISVVAPLSGLILAVRRESEGPVAQGTPFVEIGDLNSVECVADFLSEDAVKVQPGDAVTFTDWGGEPISGRVRRVEPAGFTKISALGIEEQRVNIVMDLDDPSMRQNLGHGYRFVANITIWQGTDRLIVPMSALFRDGESWAVYVIRNGRAEWRPVSIEHTNRTMADVVDGLSKGEQVVIHPPRQLEAGMRVKVRSSD